MHVVVLSVTLNRANESEKRVVAANRRRVTAPGSTNPCEIAEFCGGHIENNLSSTTCAIFSCNSHVSQW